MNRICLLTVGFVYVAAAAQGQAIPLMINYQGRVDVNGVPFDGTGQFKFALTNLAGDTYYWTNDDSAPTPPSAPTNGVSLNVFGGLYNVRLGDTSLTNMTVIPVEVFSNPGVFLRVWFDDGSAGEQQLLPDKQLTSVPYAYMAEKVAPLSVTGANLARESVWPEHQGRSNTIVSFFAKGITKDYLTIEQAPGVPYTVPAGKTLIITDILFARDEYNGANPNAWLEVAYELGGTTTILVQFLHREFTTSNYACEPADFRFKAGLPVPSEAVVKVRSWNPTVTSPAYDIHCTIAGFEFENS